MLDEVGIKKLLQFNTLRGADTKNLFSLEMIDGICKEKAPLAQYVRRNWHENALFPETARRAWYKKKVHYLDMLGGAGVRQIALDDHHQWCLRDQDQIRTLTISLFCYWFHNTQLPLYPINIALCPPCLFTSHHDIITQAQLHSF